MYIFPAATALSLLVISETESAAGQQQSTLRILTRRGYLCAKEVGLSLGVSTRTAQRLMNTNAIATFRVGKLLRTTEAEIGFYVSRQFERYRHAPKAG